MRASLILFFGALISTQPTYAFANLAPAATAAFDRYIELTESENERRSRCGALLQIDATPDVKAKVRAGETRIQSSVTRDNGKAIGTPAPIIHDWRNTSVPGAVSRRLRRCLRITRLQSVLQPESRSQPLVITSAGDPWSLCLCETQQR